MVKQSKLLSVLVVAVCLLGLCVSPCWPEKASINGNLERRDSPRLEEIILVFKTHFDIGYTDMAAQVVKRYQTSMIDSALDVVDDSRGLPEERKFIWTIPGWPMSKILEDWDGQTPERKQRLMAAFREGRFVVHGLPFTTHTETLSEEDLVRGLSYSMDLSRAAGLAPPRDAKMTDVPCHSWIMPTLLAHAGIQFLHIGTNSGSSDPKVPLLHFREGPDGSRVLGHTPPSDWPHRTWLGLIHTGDNHGPPRPDEVRQILDEIGQRMPAVKVRIGRLSDFADAILEREDLDTIPVVRGDTPDTWIYGPMCDPQGRIAARRAHTNLPTVESLTTMLESWGVEATQNTDQLTPWQSLSQGYEQSLLYGEHTWGASLGWVGHALPWGSDWQQRTDQRHRRMEASWDEHSAYANQALAISTSLLDGHLERLSQAIGSNQPRAAVYNPLPWKRDGLALIDGDTHFVHDIPPMGYRTLFSADLEPKRDEANLKEEGPASTGVLQNQFFRLRADLRTGRVTSLVDSRADRELVRQDSQGLGSFLYERFSADQCDQFMQDYALIFPKWVTTQFTKPQLPRDVPYRAARPVAATSASEIRSGVYRAIRFTYRDDPALPCRQLEYEIRLYDAIPVIDISLAITGKRPDTWPEAG
ncbi:MAG: glycoside hydrolase family 38 N-terminal domain-containing protein, partial [Planctomycetota bacterium]